MKLVLAVLLGSAIVLVLSVLCAWPTQLLWNWLMPTIFGLKSITFAQAWGLLMLSGMLLKGSSATVKS